MTHVVDGTYAGVRLPIVTPGVGGWRYTVVEPMYVDTFFDTPANFDCRFFRLSRFGRMSFMPPYVHEPYSWDGCTAVPDGGIDRVSRLPRTVCASLVHDAGYQFSRTISHVWGMTHKETLVWFDRAFLRVMRGWDVPLARRMLYYAGVRVFGHAFTHASGAVRRMRGIRSACVECPNRVCVTQYMEKQK